MHITLGKRWVGKFKESRWVGWDRQWYYFRSQRWKNYEQDETLRSCFLSSLSLVAYLSFWSLFIATTLRLLCHMVLHRNLCCLCVVTLRFRFDQAIVWWMILMSSPHSEYDLPPASSRVKQSRLASFIFAIYLEKDKDMFPSLKGIHHLPTRIMGERIMPSPEQLVEEYWRAGNVKPRAVSGEILAVG